MGYPKKLNKPEQEIIPELFFRLPRDAQVLILARKIKTIDDFFIMDEAFKKNKTHPLLRDRLYTALSIALKLDNVVLSYPFEQMDVLNRQTLMDKVIAYHTGLKHYSQMNLSRRELMAAMLDDPNYVHGQQQNQDILIIAAAFGSRIAMNLLKPQDRSKAFSHSFFPSVIKEYIANLKNDAPADEKEEVVNKMIHYGMFAEANKLVQQFEADFDESHLKEMLGQVCYTWLNEKSQPGLDLIKTIAKLKNFEDFFYNLATYVEREKGPYLDELLFAVNLVDKYKAYKKSFILSSTSSQEDIQRSLSYFLKSHHVDDFKKTFEAYGEKINEEMINSIFHELSHTFTDETSPEIQIALFLIATQKVKDENVEHYINVVKQFPGGESCAKALLNARDEAKNAGIALPRPMR